MPTQNKTIKNIDISLDGKAFIKCHFLSCSLIYSGLMHVTLKDCTFEKCKWSFAGPAKNTVGFMTGMYGLGSTEAQVIETFFANIRANATGFKENKLDDDILN